MTPRPYTIKPLPPLQDLGESVAVLQALIPARAALAELRGAVRGIPNPSILLDTLSLQEALASSEIENIVTTEDEAFKANLFRDTGTLAAKEVARYREALGHGYMCWAKSHQITEEMLIEMYQILKLSNDGYRTRSGTVIRDQAANKDIYRPPQDFQEITTLMHDLEKFINDNSLCAFDPLVKMALIHHQFESIHPFPDGNGRVGRMLNVLYLTHVGLLDEPILYLSRAINHTRQDYYRLLQEVRDYGNWEAWVLYMIAAVHDTAKSTLALVSDIGNLMTEMKHELRDKLPKIYSQDLLNNLFRYPYTRFQFVENDLAVTLHTARKYLKQLTEHDFVTEHSIGRNNYYINHRLVSLFLKVSSQPTT